MKILGRQMPWGKVETRQDEADRESIQTDAPPSSRSAWAQMLADEAAATETAAVEFGVGLLSRAFMVAEAQPALPALSPEYLAGAMRDLLLHGNHVAYIGIIGGQIVLDRAASYYITGGPSQRTWFYRGYLHGPTQNLMRQVNQAGVVHLRIGATRISPWEGVSPLSKAGITAQVLGKVERSLSQELNAITGKILTYPTIPALETAEGQQQTKAGIDALAGRMAMVQSGGGEAARWGSGGPSGGGGAWSQVGLGPEVESNMVALRAQVAQDILSILGIPAGTLQPPRGRGKPGKLSAAAYRYHQPLCQADGERVFGQVGHAGQTAIPPAGGGGCGGAGAGLPVPAPGPAARRRSPDTVRA